MTTITQAANEARGLAMDSIASAKSGHLGLPLGCAEMGAILFGTDSGLSYNPKDPSWLNRDRFILSAGHGSMFVYSWLHLAGYDIPLEEVKNFRQHHSMTPGHPEFPSSLHATPGIESTTGPLGQVRTRFLFAFFPLLFVLHTAVLLSSVLLLRWTVCSACVIKSSVEC